MSLTCKLQVTLNNISEKKAHAVRMALEPDNVDFPENLTLEVENVDNKLVFNFKTGIPINTAMITVIIIDKINASHGEK